MLDARHEMRALWCLFHESVIVPMRFIYMYLAIDFHCIIHHVFGVWSTLAGHTQIAIELLNAQVPKLRVPEEVLLCEGQVILRVGVVRHTMDVAWIPLIPEGRLPNETRRRELARSCRSDTLKLQQPIEAHAEAHRTGFQPILEGVILGLQVIPSNNYRT